MSKSKNSNPATETTLTPQADTVAEVTAAPDEDSLQTMQSGGEVAPLGQTAPVAPPYNIMQVSAGIGFAPDLGILPGLFCLNREAAITQKGEDLIVIINRVESYWREWPETFSPGRELQTFPSKEAAREAGMIVDWPPRGSNGPRRNVGPGMRMELFIRKPEKCANEVPFCLLLNGERYAPAIFFVERSLFGISETRSQVARMLSTLMFNDAATRGVPPAEGKANRYFIRLSLIQNVSRTDASRKFHTLNAHPLTDGAGKPIPVDEQTHADLEALADSLANPTTAMDEDLPF